jgi:hypothetical protein
MPDLSGPGAALVPQPRAHVYDRLRAGSLALDVTLASGAALVLGLIRLGTPALWYDEAYTYRQIQRGFIEQFEGYQPFYYWILKPWTSVVGTSEWALRFPSVVGAMIASALLVVLARKLFDRSVALLSGFLLATSPFFVKWSQQARIYPLVTAACLLAILLLLRAFERGSRAAWALFGVAYALVLVSHAAVGLLLLPAAAVLIAQRRKQFLPHGLLAVVIVTGVGLTWIAQLAMRTSSDTSETAWIPFPSAETATRALADVSGIAGIGVLFALVGLWMLFRTGEGSLVVWLATWAFGPWAAALAISVVRPMFLDRYLVVAAPAFSMLSAVAVMGLAVRARAAAVALGIAATCVGLVLWYGDPEPGNWRGEDWRSAAAAVSDRRGEATETMIVPWWAHDAPEYYGADVTYVARADSVWVLTWSETGGDLSRAERRTLGFGDHRLVERLDFGRRVSAQLWKREP